MLTSLLLRLLPSFLALLFECSKHLPNHLEPDSVASDLPAELLIIHFPCRNVDDAPAFVDEHRSGSTLDNAAGNMNGLGSIVMGECVPSSRTSLKKKIGQPPVYVLPQRPMRQLLAREISRS